MNGSRAILIAALVGLVSGASLGLMGGILFSRSMFSPPRMERHMRRGGDPQREMLGRLERQLHLEPAQRARIEDLLAAARRDMAASRESLHVRIGRELTPEQLREWQQMESRRRTPGRHRGQGPPPGDEPRPEGGGER